ncbi:MAG: TRAP transporter permease, partial [Planctomycetota bacterium]
MLARTERNVDSVIIAVLSIAWALFQLALPRFIILDSITIRAVHLAFAIALVFLTFPITKHRRKREPLNERVYIPPTDYILAGCASLSALYIVFDWTGISMRAGVPIWRDIIIS